MPATPSLRDVWNFPGTGESLPPSTRDPMSLPPVFEDQPGGSGPALPQLFPQPALPTLELQGVTGFVAPNISAPPVLPGAGTVTLSARLVEGGEDISRGLVWRVFSPEPGADGRLPLIATAQGGTSSFELEPGSYLIHASFGRAGATKRVTVSGQPRNEQFVLDAGGLMLDAVMSDGQPIPADRVRFSIYEESSDAAGERPLVIPDVSPKAVVRLKSGTYHVVSTYGAVNAVIRSDIRVEAGKLTEATVEHRAAELTMKLVREPGGEAIADTSWSILTDSGDIVRESVGAFASMVLAEGDYVAIAKNREKIYQREFAVVPGHNRDVEVLAEDETNGSDAPQ